MGVAGTKGGSHDGDGRFERLVTGGAAALAPKTGPRIPPGVLAPKAAPRMPPDALAWSPSLAGGAGSGACDEDGPARLPNPPASGENAFAERLAGSRSQMDCIEFLAKISKAEGEVRGRAMALSK